MLEQEDLLQKVLDNLQTISSILDGKKDIEEFLNKKSSLTGSEVFKKVVKLVDNLYDSINIFRTDFLKGCDSLCHSVESDPNIVSLPPDNTTDKAENIDTHVNTELCNSTGGIKDGADDGSVIKCQTEPDPTHSVEKRKIGIKLIDINKLIDTGSKTFDTSPKLKKSVKFDNSVVILDSSDEESFKKCSPKKRQDNKIKSVLKQSPAKENSSSDSDNVKNRKDKSRKKKVSKKVSNRSSESELVMLSDSEGTETETRCKKSSSNMAFVEPPVLMDSSSDADFSDHLETKIRKTRSAKNKEITQNKFKNLREAVFKRRKHLESRRSASILSDESDDDSENHPNNTSTRVTKNGKKCDEDNNTSLSDNDTDPKKAITTILKIPLPRIECEKLEQVYLKEKGALNKSKSENSKRSRSETEVTNFSDSDKPLSKKTKGEKNEILSEMISHENKTNSVDKNSLNTKKPADAKDLNEKTQLEKSQKLPSGSDVKKDQSDAELPRFGNNFTENKEKSKVHENKESENCENEVKTKLNDNENNDEDLQNTKDKEKNKNDKISNKNGKHEDEEDNNDTESQKLKNNCSGSEEEFSAFCKKKDIPKKQLLKKARRRLKKSTVISDSDSDAENSDREKINGNKHEDEQEEKGKNKSRKKIKKVISDSESDNDKADAGSDKDWSEEESGTSENEQKSDDTKLTRSRIKRTKESSSDEEDKSTRKHIRRVIGKDSLSETTKRAEAEEKERKARIIEKQSKYNQIFDLKMDAKIDKVVLDYNEDTKEEQLVVNLNLVKKLKPHQASGIQFMWDACFESLDRIKKTTGSGCILAHCMGLGKTLQVITLVHTLLTNSEKTKVKKVMVVCPVNTVLNWKSEFKKWLPEEDDCDVYELVSCKQNYERQYTINEWHENGGVLIIGYTMFRNLSSPDNKKISKKMRMVFQEGLVDPGPDLVVCDEGHLLKNEKTNLSIAMNRIKTLRRIVLTGTPLQNNLREYWCMVQFIKPNLLGSYKEYLNRFVNPIINGQYTDSTPHDIDVMRRRSHVLHKLLDGVVQRRDYAVLEPYLPPKHEYVLFVPLTETQVQLYQHYMDKFSRQNDGSNRTSFLFTDFQVFQRICTHPRVLLDKSLENDKKERLLSSDEDEGSLKDFIDDGSDSEESSSSGRSSESADSEASIKSQKKKSARGRLTRAQAAERRQTGEISDESNAEETKPKEWWQQYCDGSELEKIENSGKMLLLFEMLKECDQIGDKVLIFSQSLYTLNCIEYFLERIDEATQTGNIESVSGYSGSWALGLDYFRLDGSSSCENRATWCDSFNNPKNTRARLFLISTRAGGLGINLVAANRVIIFDVSWNPSHDIQSIYRVYRFGQTKPCYVYRFVSFGTMEMKIYERQVTKQAISKRVIDEQQIDRHYSQNDIQELYKCDLTPTERPIPLVPKDVLLGEMLQKYEKYLFKYHEHQSLLENKRDEELNEEERKAAWEEFENEKVIRNYNASVSSIAGLGGFGNVNTAVNFSPHTISMALTNIVRKDNPTWSEIQIKGVIPALVQQLRVQLSEGDYSMYNRVQNEIRLFQIETQKLKQFYQQQQMLRALQAQHPADLIQNRVFNPYVIGNLMSSGSVPQPLVPSATDVIELND